MAFVFENILKTETRNESKKTCSLKDVLKMGKRRTTKKDRGYATIQLIGCVLKYSIYSFDS